MRAHRLLPSFGASSFTPFRNHIITTFRSRPQAQCIPPLALSGRPFSSTKIKRKDEYAEQAKSLNQKGQDELEASFNSQIDHSIGEAKELQTRTPWHREGSDKPPVKRMRSAGAMTKGRFPSRSLLLRRAASFESLKKSERLEKADIVLLCRKATYDAVETTEAHPSTHNIR